MKNKILLIASLVIMVASQLKAQLNVGSTSAPNPSAMLQVTSSNKGLLLPNVALTATNSPVPLAAHVAGMVVYNTATAGSGSVAVTPGIYVNDGTKWGTYASASFNSSANFTSGTISCGGTLSGTYAQNTAMTSSNTKVISITATSGGSYTATTDQKNGVTFAVSGTLYSTGAGTQITLVGSGTPTGFGVFTYTVLFGGQTCTFDVNYTQVQAVYTLNCAVGTAAAGNYITGFAMTSSNTKTVTVNVTATGQYSLSTTNVNGISFAATGTFTTLGSQSVTLNATGTPSAAGNNAYPVSGAGQSCNFNVTTSNPTFSAQLTFSGSLSSVNGAGTYIPFNGIANETSNFGAGSGIISGGNFVAPVTGTYTLLINSMAYTTSGANHFDVIMSGTLFSSYTGGGPIQVSVYLNKGDALGQYFQACSGCSPMSGAYVTDQNLQVTLQ